MKKRLWPRGYRYNTANLIGGLILIIGVFLFKIIVDSAGYPIKTSVWLQAGGPIAAIGAIFVIMDIIKIKKVRELRRQREVMMQKMPIRGKIVDIKRFDIDYRGRQTVKYSNGHRMYQLEVSYLDPMDDKMKTGLSDWYEENLAVCLSSEYVDVYLLGNNGVVLIDGLKVRKFGEDKIRIGNERHRFEDSDIMFYIDIYGRIIIPIASIVGILIAVGIFFFMSNSLRG